MMGKLADKIKTALRGRNPLVNVDKGMVHDIIEAIANAAEEFVDEKIDAAREKDKDGAS